MALEPSKLIVFGPFSLSFKLVAAQTVAYAGLKPDSLTLSVETKKGMPSLKMVRKRTGTRAEN